MSKSETPSNNPLRSFIQRVNQMLKRLIAPHPSLKGTDDFRRAQLLAILTLITSVLLISAFLYNPRSYGAFVVLIVVSLGSFALSKTIYYRLGTYLFAYAFTAFGFLRIYTGSALSIESSIVSTVHIALIFSSVLLSRRGFLSLVILTAIATFAAPLYSKVPELATENIFRIGGIIVALGTILYGINFYRELLEKEQQKELNAANRELQNVKINLEERIEDRTHEINEANQKLEQRALRLQLISELSQEISANVEQKPAELLTQIAQSISETLGFYHVGIFLLDEKREYAVLRATNSRSGQDMLKRHHQLRVGGTGMVGYVSQSGRPRIALDTGADVVYFNNPDLPETRSEMVLPLKYGTQVIGILDVQSTLPSAFNDEDVEVLNTLANQIAFVIKNIQASEQARFSISATKPNKQGNRAISSDGSGGYSYLPNGTISTAIPLKGTTLDKALASGEPVILPQTSKDTLPTLAVPVKLRDQVIGIIYIEADEASRKWTEDEVAMVQAISDRAALALENARLFEDANRRAEQEQTIAHVTSQIGASTDFNRIMQTTIQELGQALGVSRSFIQMGTSSENGNGKSAGSNPERN